MSAHLDGLDLFELLDLLEPAPEPAPVSMMPQTIGWIWLGIALVVALAFGARAYLRHRNATAYRRAGLAALRASGDDPEQIATILRRTALAGYPRAEVAGLTGADWLAFLDRTMNGKGFVHGPGRVLSRAPYTDTPPEPDLRPLADQWIRTHRTPARVEQGPAR